MTHIMRAGAAAAAGDDPSTKAARGRQMCEMALRGGDAATLEEAIGLLREAMTTIDDDQVRLLQVMSNLSTAYHERFDRFGDRTDIDKAVDAAQRALDLAVTVHRCLNPPVLLANLAIRLWTRHERYLSDDDLERAVAYTRTAAAAAKDPRVLATIQSTLAMMLKARFDRFGDRDDIDEAITLGRSVVADTADDDLDLPRHLTDLATVLYARYNHTASDTDLSEGLDIAERAVAYSGPDDRDLPRRHSHLSLALWKRFERFDDVAALDRAVDYARRAVDATDTSSPQYAEYASNLAGALITRFERRGDTSEINSAVTWARSAVTHAPDGHAGRHRYLTSLGAALRLRFQWLGNMSDLDEAVVVHRCAADAVPNGDGDYRVCQNNLAVALLEQFTRAADEEALDEAIAVARASVTIDALGRSHPHHARHLSNLGTILLATFGARKDTVYLDEAVNALHEALEATPRDSQDCTRRMAHLALAHWYRFVANEQEPDLDQALALSEEALARVAPDHLERALYLPTLVAAAAEQFERDGRSARLDQALVQVARMIDEPAIAVRDRVRLAGVTAHAAADRHGPKAAMPYYHRAIDLIPQLVRRDLTTGDHLHLLDQSVPHLGCEAAACAIAAGDPQLALTLLEQGRAVLWGSLLDTRTDFGALRAAYPAIADEIERCRRLIEAPHADSGSGDLHQELRRQAGDRFGELVKAARQLSPAPGFAHPDRFMQPPQLQELLPPRGTGPVVVLNDGRRRCDALVVTAAGVEVVELGFTGAEATRQTNVYLEALQLFDAGDPLARVPLETATTAVLRWLWDAVAEPVLERLGYTGTPSGQWPRLWWCPTGPLTLLPIHAAGYHTVDGKSVLDRVVSSYTPTLRSLAHARSVAPATQQERMLIATVPSTPGPDSGARFRRLNGAEAERALLRGLFDPVQRTDLTGAEVTHEALGTALRSHRWAHLACHGKHDLERPTTGGLVPFDWQDRGLIGLDDLTGPDGAGGEFVFLSACQTATGSITGIDEAVNLASAMQYAGWRHVIGTLWTVDDDAAGFIAERLYGELVVHGRLDSERSPYALHWAVRELRARDREHHSLWSRFIHLGP